MAITVTQYLPFAMLPFISYLTIVYIHPIISYYLRQYLQKTDNSFYIKRSVNLDDDEQKAKVKVAKIWKVLHLIGLVATNWYVYYALVMLYIPLAQFIYYSSTDKDFLLSIDQYILYIHKANILVAGH